jgi:hypothetical protein
MTTEVPIWDCKPFNHDQNDAVSQLVAVRSEWIGSHSIPLNLSPQGPSVSYWRPWELPGPPDPRQIPQLRLQDSIERLIIPQMRAYESHVSTSLPDVATIRHVYRLNPQLTHHQQAEVESIDQKLVVDLELTEEVPCTVLLQHQDDIVGMNPGPYQINDQGVIVTTTVQGVPLPMLSLIPEGPNLDPINAQYGAKSGYYCQPGTDWDATTGPPQTHVFVPPKIFGPKAPVLNPLHTQLAAYIENIAGRHLRTQELSDSLVTKGRSWCKQKKLVDEVLINQWVSDAVIAVMVAPTTYEAKLNNVLTTHRAVASFHDANRIADGIIGLTRTQKWKKRFVYAFAGVLDVAFPVTLEIPRK